jgi:virulence-associated protein VapD
VFAIAFDLVVADAQQHHPVGVTQAYSDIAATLERRGYDRVQGSLYISQDENLATLFLAMQDLRALPWLRRVVRDIRAFRVEQWSDFTNVQRAP